MIDIKTEIDTLARTIWGEDRGGSNIGMIAVANVVTNRVAAAKEFFQSHGRSHPLFGNGSFSDCCKKPEQFSCWNLGNPNLSKLLRVNTSDLSFSSALKIATIAVNGSLEDTTHGATYYYAKTISETPNWALNQTPCADIAGQLFFKL